MDALRAAYKPGQSLALRLCRVLSLTLALALWMAALPSNAQERPPEKRIALVVGNSQYPKVPLDNPVNAEQPPQAQPQPQPRVAALTPPPPSPSPAQPSPSSRKFLGRNELQQLRSARRTRCATRPLPA